MGIRFRLTFHHSSPGFFRFDEQSVPLDLGDELTLNLTARDADTLAKAKRFHIEGRGFASEEAARSVGERLRLRLRVLNSLLGLGITVPVVDSRRAAVADAVKEKVRRETGGVIVDTIEGLAVISDDPDHFEQVVAGGASVYPSDPAYVLTALAVVWPVEMQLDERAEDALEILGVATTELSPRAKFLTTYLALERMIDRLTRSEAAQKLIEELQDRVQESALDGGDKKSLVSSLGNLREQSFRTALPFFGASIPGFVGLLTGRGPFSPAFALIPGRSRTTEQPNSKAVCVEVHSTRPAELAKACVAALLSSFRCLTPEARITTTLFVKRTTKVEGSGTGSGSGAFGVAVNEKVPAWSVANAKATSCVSPFPSGVTSFG
ncbi:MAG: hypothetical protein ACLQIB_19620 [Isosphaeraceae bacterium]